jgi:hypothetical protein
LFAKRTGLASGRLLERNLDNEFEVTAMPTENEPITAEKLRRKPIVASLGKCKDCGQPAMEGQDFRRLDNGIRHTLCFYEPAYAKRVRELNLTTEQ